MTEAQKALEEAKKKASQHQGYMPGDVQEAATKAVAEAMAKQAEAFKAQQEQAALVQAAKERDEYKAKYEQSLKQRKIRFGTGPDVAPGWVAGVALDEQTKAAQRAHDSLLFMAQAIHAKRSDMGLKEVMGYVVEEAKQNPNFAPIIKAMATASGSSGDDWVWTEYSPDFIRRVDLEAKVAGLLRMIPMNAQTLVIPAIGTRPSVYLLSEPTSDTADNLPATTPGDGKITLTAKSLGGMVWISEDLDDDAIRSASEVVTEDIIMSLARHLDQAITDGDATGAHFDDDVTSSTEHRKAFNGMINHAITGGFTRSLNTFTADSLRLLRGDMGKYGVDPSKLFWAVGIKSYVNKLLNLKDSQNNAMVTTMDKLGADATNIKGALGAFDGIPIVVSETMREDVSADGTHNGTTVADRGRLLLVYRDGWILGRRPDVGVKPKPFEERSQVALIFKIRRALQAAYSTTEPIAALGYNIAFS
jgi:HK97 family phage major capsid protein